MYLLGLRALGHEVFYIEDTGECVYDPIQNTRATDPTYGTTYIHDALEPFGLGDRWSFVNYDGSYHGRSADDVRRYAADADLFINLSGGSWFWRDEYARIPRKVFIDSDPAFTQLAIAKAEPWYVEFFQRFDHLFTFGSNIGTPASPIPTGDFTWHKTWQPVTLDDWTTDTPPGDRFTTVMTWQIESFADVGGNKDQEFVKFIELPSRTTQPFELAINGPQALLREHGWETVDAMRVSRTPWEYATSFTARRPNSASPSTPTSRRDPAGSAIGPSAISRRAARRSCRTPAGPRICRTATGYSPSRRLMTPRPPSSSSTATTNVTPARPWTSRTSTSTRAVCCLACWRRRARDECRSTSRVNSSFPELPPAPERCVWPPALDGVVPKAFLLVVGEFRRESIRQPPQRRIIAVETRQNGVCRPHSVFNTLCDPMGRQRIEHDRRIPTATHLDRSFDRVAASAPCGL